MKYQYHVVDFQHPEVIVGQSNWLMEAQNLLDELATSSGVKSMGIIRTDDIAQEVVGGTKWLRELAVEHRAYTTEQLRVIVKEKRWEI